MTTSTRSANGPGLPDRRHFLSTLGAVSALGMATVPALAADHPDAELLALGREWAAADRLAEAADRRLSEVSATYDSIAPDHPAVFVREDDDLGLESRPEMRKGKPTGRFYYGSKEIEAAELALLVAQEPGFPLPDNPKARRRLARLQEIVDLRAARRAAWISAGMDEAEHAYEAAGEVCRELRAQIAERSATTLAGVLLKVRVTAGCFGDTLDLAEAEIGALIEGGDGESMVYSIARDLIRIADRNATGGAHA